MRDCSDAPDPAVVQRDGVHCGVDHDGSDRIQVSYRDFWVVSAGRVYMYLRTAIQPFDSQL